MSGLVENENEDPYDVTMKFIQEDLGLGDEITINDIDRCHRIGPKTNTERPRQMILKLATYRIRRKVYSARKKLIDDDSTIYVNEDLTRARATTLWEARKVKKTGKIKECWTSDGAILVRKEKNSKPVVIHNAKDLEQL